MQIKGGEFLKDPSYNLEKSWLWAHVQSHDGREHSRLLAPRRLRPLTSYIAALVPAWDDRGKPSWSNAAVPQTLRALFSWRFQTTESGDFETLVAALQVKAEGELGKVTVDYQIADSKIEFKVFGAISSRTRPADTDERIQSDLALKVSEEALADGAPAIGLPFYGRPWRNDPQTTKWGQQIFDDPRLRVPAGIGMWMGMEAQEQLLAAGIEQAGALDIARRRVASLVAGVQSNRSLQKRRLPESRLARLWVLAPVMARFRQRSVGHHLDRFFRWSRTTIVRSPRLCFHRLPEDCCGEAALRCATSAIPVLILKTQTANAARRETMC